MWYKFAPTEIGSESLSKFLITKTLIITILWKSDSPFSTFFAFKKLSYLLVTIRSMHEGFVGFLKQLWVYWNIWNKYGFEKSFRWYKACGNVSSSSVSEIISISTYSVLLFASTSTLFLSENLIILLECSFRILNKESMKFSCFCDSSCAPFHFRF